MTMSMIGWNWDKDCKSEMRDVGTGATQTNFCMFQTKIWTVEEVVCGYALN